MGCCVTCGKILLVIVNLIFLVIGLALFVLGFFCKFGNDVLKSYYQPALDSLSTSLSSSGFGTVDLSTFDLTELIGSLGVAFILAGTIMLLITVLGFLGACCKIKFMLIVYCILVGTVVIAEIILFSILIADKEIITNDIKSSLRSGIQSDYQGLNGTNVVSISWNFVHYQVQCCGVDGYTDFTGATQWPINYQSHTLQTPLSCCRVLPTSLDFTCASSPTTSINYLNTGCFDEIWDLALGNAGLMGGVFAGLGLFQIMLIVFGICLVMDGRQNKVGDNTPRGHHGNKKRTRWDD